MKAAFNDITLDKAAEYYRRLASCPVIASDYSLVNLYGWAPEYQLTWALEDDLVWIRQDDETAGFWAPVGDWNNVSDWPGRLEVLGTPPLTFHRVPETLKSLWEEALAGRIDTEETPGDRDYLYNRTDLAELAGNKFHKKKNLVNQFWKKYDAEYLPLTAETVELARSLQQDWCEWKDCESIDVLDKENRVIAQTLSAWNRFDELTGGALKVGDDLAAYTVGEYLPGDTLLIHFEKGNPDYKGCYQAINQAFVARARESTTMVNREQDLDNEGIRKAKLSYNPVDFIKKYRVTIR